MVNRHCFAGRLERFLTWVGAVEEGAVYRLPVPNGYVDCVVHADRVVCSGTGPGGPAPDRVFRAQGDDLAGALPVMKAIADMALVYIPCTVSTEPDGLLAGRPTNTAITYEFRDGPGMRSSSSVTATVVLAGVPAPGELEMLMACMNEDATFLPGEVGLADLQGVAPGWHERGSDDIWHQVCAVRTTAATQTDERSFSEFATQVAEHVLNRGWDEDYVPQLQAESLRSRPREVAMR